MAAKSLLLLLSLLFSAALPCRALEKWIYVAKNLAVDTSIDEIEQLMKTGQAAGYDHMLLADSKFSRLAEMNAPYFRNVERVKALSAKYQFEIVPAVFPVGYSNDILGRDVNLIEALPVKGVPLIVQGGTAHVDDPELSKLPPDFSDWKKWGYHDPTVVWEDGAAHIADAKGGNARVSIKLKVQPWRQYHVSVSVKSQDFKGEPEVKALASRQLNWEKLGVKPTQDWTVHHAVFNSEENSEVTLYFGVWGSKSGALWWKEPRLEEIAFMNMPRRAGCPLVVARAPGADGAPGAPLVEGRDFEPLKDPLLGQKPWPGEYDTFHEPPALHTKLPDGTKLVASYYNAQTVYDHQAMICPSEPKTMQLLRDQAIRMHKLWGAKGYMMSHDEIRVLDWCEACQNRHLTPGQLLADNVKQCISILREVNPDGRIYVWSDMFDPNHNAVKGPYYLVNGSYDGSWDGLDKDVIILPWYYEKRAESLKFFADRGNKQVIAGYYDSKPERVVDWLNAAKTVPGSVIGVMYTTWQNRYGDLGAFAKAVDGAK